MNWFESKITVMDTFLQPVRSSVKIIRKSGAKVWKTLLQNPRVNPQINEEYEKTVAKSLTVTDLSNNTNGSVKGLGVNPRNGIRKKYRRSQKFHKTDYDYIQRTVSLDENEFNMINEFSSTMTRDDIDYENFLEKDQTEYRTPYQTKSQNGLDTSYFEDITSPSVSKFGTNCITKKSKFVSEPYNLDNKENEKISILGQEREQIISVSNRSCLKNIYEPLEDETFDRPTWENILQERFLVGLSDVQTRRRSPICTPICKSSNKKWSQTELTADSLPRKNNFSHQNNSEKDSLLTISCGSTDQLNISFSSSHGSEESISGLLSEYENVEDTVEESDIHFKTFDFLRKKRDEQFFLMREITKKLKVLRSKPEKKILEGILHAEREFLFSTEIYKNCIFNMTNSSYLLKEDLSNTNATVTISKILIPMKNGSHKELHSYYVCIARTDAAVLVTKCTQPEGPDGAYYLPFEDELVFEKLENSFRIDLKVYEINFNKRRNIFKKSTVNKSLEIHHYRHQSSTKNEKQHLLQPAFKQCGGFEITLKNLQRTRIFNHFPNSVLSKTATVSKNISDLNIKVRKRGFLHFGQRHAQDDLIIWNLKYVVLEESELRIYNSPTDVECTPLVKIDLKKICSELVSHICHLKYCFQMDIVCEESNFHFTFKYPYFLRANNSSDFESWLEQLNNVMNILKNWQMLEYVN